MVHVSLCQVHALCSWFDTVYKSADSVESVVLESSDGSLAALCTVVTFSFAVKALCISCWAFLTGVPLPATVAALLSRVGLSWLFYTCLCITCLVPLIVSVSSITLLCLTPKVDGIKIASFIVLSAPLITCCYSWIASLRQIAFSQV